MRKSQPEQRRARFAGSRGFTLIEVVVALAVAALGLGFLMAAAGTGLRNTDIADQHIEAIRRAQSRLAMVGTIVPLRPSELSGDDGGGYSWRLRISPPVVHADPQGAGTQQALGLFTVEVTIGWRNGAGIRDVSLRSQRLGRVGGNAG